MAHLYWLAINVVDIIDGKLEEVEQYLFDNNLISEIVEKSPGYNMIDVCVKVPNKGNFERYLNRRPGNRDEQDPRPVIKNVKYEGIIGKAVGSSKEGRQIAARIRNVKKKKKAAEKKEREK